MAVDTLERKQARRGQPRRAFSLLELTVVLAIVGLLAGAAMMRFGHAALNTTDTEGFVRRLVLDMRLARRAVIATGDEHYIRFNRVGGVIDGYDLLRDVAGDDEPIQPSQSLPTGTTIDTAATAWRFRFSGELAPEGGPSSLQVEGTNHVWTVNGYQATGVVRTSRAAIP